MKILRIVFCILSCACILAAIPVGICCDVAYLLVDLFAALAFGGAMLLCKRKTDASVRSTDFMNSEEENERIRKENDRHRDEP